VKEQALRYARLVLARQPQNQAMLQLVRRLDPPRPPKTP
jgi:hypothetical protein